MQPPPENNDGRTFLSRDSSVEMRAWGQYNAFSRTLREEYEDALKGFGEKPSYMMLGKSSFVLSGIKEGKIFYQKTLYRKNNDAFYTLTIEYPQTQRKKYDPIVTRISNSFRLV
jgi:serine/threonine-protein kinase